VVNKKKLYRWAVIASLALLLGLIGGFALYGARQLAENLNYAYWVWFLDSYFAIIPIAVISMAAFKLVSILVGEK
jgi:hypothetical protein